MADLLEITHQLRMRARTTVDPADRFEAYFICAPVLLSAAAGVIRGKHRANQGRTRRKETFASPSSRPAVLIVAPHSYRARGNAETTIQFHSLAEAVSRLLPMRIRSAELCDAELVEMGLNGRAPRIEGHAFLRSIGIAAVQQEGRGPDAREQYLRHRRDNLWEYARTLTDPGQDA